MDFRELEKIIKADGWKLQYAKGSHYQYKHDVKRGKVTISRHKRDIDITVIKSVLRQAGLK